jgi:hypothetical protein
VIDRLKEGLKESISSGGTSSSGGGGTNSPGGSIGGGHRLGDDSAIGSELFQDLPIEERKMELGELMMTVQTQIDLESDTRTELERQLDHAESVLVQARLETSIASSDERMSLLASRMLRVMSALQSSE